MTRANDIARGYDFSTGIDAGEVLPHIIPDTLYPAVAGKLLDGSTSHSGDYGTAQADGRSYFYTDIKGSRKIADPRIGSHFGSQRHQFSSLQQLEQETATHGDDVFSLDGREWLRAVGTAWYIANDSTGNYLRINNSSTEFVEITGYFNDINMHFHTATDSPDAIDVFIDGTENATTNISAFKTTVNTPLGQRYVNTGSLHNVGLQSTSLGIHTIKLIMQDTGHTAYCRFSGIELIAQDTTSTATKSQIQIPSQNVVSYGKKFTVSGTPHYNPFAFKTDGTTAWASGAHNGTAWPVGTGSSANIDTATSLGLEAWVSTNYYKPYNGGRVVWWVDSSGTLKCSVNMMPPNARNISSTASNEKGDDSAGTTSAAVANSQYLPTFTDQAIDHSQAEVAKSFHWREFGNGGANAGTGGANYADASMLSATDDIAYVMDDGLTSLSGDDVERSVASINDAFRIGGYSDYVYLTFIGTGISFPVTYGWIHSEDSGETVRFSKNIAQNLPYGTHILKLTRESGGDNNDGTVILDGVTILSNIQNILFEQVTIHQPKMPPIPEDAVVIADYMLMADFVAVGAEGVDKISKGVRVSGSSRDHFYDVNSVALNIAIEQTHPSGLRIASDQVASGESCQVELPYFGTDFVINTYGDRFGTVTEALNGDVGTSATIGTTDHAACVKHTGNNLALNKMKNIKSNSGYFWHASTEIATPIHTSHHYQTFETPFLHELVGGDRNMEQNNLVVTPDGKSWDEVTRDTSYLGNMVLNIGRDTGTVAENVVVIFDEILGSDSNSGGDAYLPHFYKDFAIAYDRQICLVDGQYVISYMTNSAADVTDRASIFINGKRHFDSYTNDASYWNAIGGSVSVHLKRGDYIQIKGGWFHANSPEYSSYHIERV